MCLARELAASARELTQKVNDLVAENRKEGQYQAHIKELAAQTYDVDDLKASEGARERLTQLLAISGLANDTLSLKPVTGLRSGGIYREIGWAIHARGPLSSVIDFLYLVSAEPRLHRLDYLTINPVTTSWRPGHTTGTGGDVDMQVRYGTLVLEGPKGGKSPAEGVKAVPLPLPKLDGPGRKAYELIAMRDILRPYVPRGPVENTAIAATAPDSPDAHLKVVALPSYAARAEIYVDDTSRKAVTRYNPGDALGGGRIVMVDYRQLPRHDKPFMFASSRVILLIQSDYWAVDLGANLADRYRLDPAELPPKLQSELQNLPPTPAPTTMPATSPAESEQVGG